MGRLDGKVAMITGAARGQGRSHALTFAREGAQIIATDICAPLPAVNYPAATSDDLAETIRLVEELDQRCLAFEADARDAKAMQTVVDAAVAELGGIDILHVNHGIVHLATWEETTEEIWTTQIDTILTGTWRTVRPVIPHMIERGGGSIIFTSSAVTIAPYYQLAAYGAAKSGLLGLMRVLAAELAPHWIRVNCIAPGNVGTTMILNEAVLDEFSGKKGATKEDVRAQFEELMLLPEAFLDPSVISGAALFLASDEGRFVTGVNFPVDAGSTNQPAGVPPAAYDRLMKLGREQA